MIIWIKSGVRKDCYEGSFEINLTGPVDVNNDCFVWESILMKSMFKSLIKSVLRIEARDTYHKQHGDQANGILKTLESEFGRTNPNDIRLAEEYALDVYGDICYAPWLRVYTAFAGEFREGWVPDNYYGRVVIPRIKGGYGRIGDLKSLTRIVFDSDAFPDVIYFVNGLFFSTNFTLISRSDVSDFLFRKSESVVFKLDNSLQGKGVFFIDKSSFSIRDIERLGNGVFQERIVQHPLFESFAKNSVATLRVTTVIDDSGLVSVRACYLRFGREGDTHVQSNSHVRVPISLNDGGFGDKAYLPNWLMVSEHPDSKMIFSGNKVPLFRECISMIIELHKRMPIVRCIGWDVSVDRSNVVRVMEWNSWHNDIKFSEATQGPCFADLGWSKFVRWNSSE